jgi:stage V sporulation protein AC
VEFPQRCFFIFAFQLGKLPLEGFYMNAKQYDALVKRHSPNSPIVKDCFFAFLIGGLICCVGQFFLNWYQSLGLSKETAGTACSVTLVAISALLTGLSLYDNIAKYAGAGTLVPITGFSNAVTAPAMEFRTEGLVLGTGAKMFIIAGPVIVYGLAAGAVYGLIYYFVG